MQLSYISSVVILGLISGTHAVPFVPLELRGVSPDNTCGKNGTGGSPNAYTCPTGLPCCSRYGWCGSTAAYCSSADGCQPGFGTCKVYNVTSRGPTDHRCGHGVGSCASNECCSFAGYCGTTEEYCRAPDCQFDYGPACDANKVPSGTNTSSIARPAVGSVLYGSDGIYDCANAGDMALSFDDGPYIYTSHILDLLDEYNAKATFFVTGNNNGPPYSSCTAECGCEADLKELGYHITYFSLDTSDYLNDSPTLISNSQNIFSKAVNGSNPATDEFLVVSHDIHNQTSKVLVEYMLKSATEKGYRPVTVGTCLGDDEKNWYRVDTESVLGE
ncbi:hypothetical protein ACMFMG_008882 [Clarireedia jacksonii]